MPVGSFVRGMTAGRADGLVHAGEPQDGTSVCGGLELELDAAGRSFVPWAEGSCPRCSESLVPTAPPPPP